MSTRRTSRGGAAVQIGRLVSLHIKTPGGDLIHKVNLPLAWRPSGKGKGDLLIGKRSASESKGDMGALTSQVITVHRKFHQGNPSSARRIAFPDAGNWRSVGKIVALTYRVPKGIISPQKNPYYWHHWFGDHGERGHGEAGGSQPKYPDKYFPMLMVNEQNDMKIVRVRGNRYYVTDWLYY